MQAANHPQLYPWLKEKIRRSPGEKISFAQYMESVLYHPEFGYYSAYQTEIGKSGDYFTSASLGADFGQLLARQWVQMWQILGCPTPFSLVEMGAGTGQVAADVLGELEAYNSECFQSLDYRIIEKSAGLRQVQQHTLEPWLGEKSRVQWCDWADLDGVQGCFFSNELIDAFPVHVVVRSGERLQEVFVTLDAEEHLGEVLGELSTPKLAQYFDRLGIDLCSEAYPEGYRTEVNLGMLEWLEAIAQRLERGYVVTIDYGYTADRYYQPGRSTGTLQCYTRHHRHDCPYINIGYQDITAHVDFTTLEQEGKGWGLEPLGFTEQGLFLMALGLGDRLAALSESSLSITQLFSRRDALHQLIDPLGLGGFKVLIQGKGLTEQEKGTTLQGLDHP
ncbi:class I SAM-dependent methyltransferase [Roseofilum sp. BLCC_M154]|uniref:Class I SAM-dependent methyltransferase n=1 Tax=Roseofilum acuticapitatum BLCC-M154 TaxID=3022444 RepID=A0ABT7AQN7_9CYAN|nr:class I SAM-dependent methyltransferase [Roseofilum acuticapitatum]MDJ1169210.1 class I SAM-dependent methyltransferase [Roseofilum acuticapitatum BLCC-M154]